jgi:hypothetical protein
MPLSFRTNWSADARISSSVAGGSKLASVLMFRHIVLGFPRGFGRSVDRRAGLSARQARRKAAPYVSYELALLVL